MIQKGMQTRTHPGKFYKQKTRAMDPIPLVRATRIFSMAKTLIF